MTIGAIGAYSFQPYVYNTNNVSAASMNRLSKISDDVLDKKIDYSELAEEESQNINPLRRGQTLNFQSILEMQMQRGQNNAARIMRPAQEPQDEEQETAQASTSNTNVAQFVQTSAPEQETAASASTAETANANTNSDNNNISYQMQQALNAYGMFMTA